MLNNIEFSLQIIEMTNIEAMNSVGGGSIFTVTSLASKQDKSSMEKVSWSTLISIHFVQHFYNGFP